MKSSNEELRKELKEGTIVKLDNSTLVKVVSQSTKKLYTTVETRSGNRLSVMTVRLTKKD